MVKLYLSSYRIPNPAALFDLIGKEPRHIRAAIIPNAKDYYAQRARNIKIRDAGLYLKSLDITAETIDLNGYSDPSKLREALANFDIVWVMGGNTFCLRHAMQASGFEKIVRDLLEKGIVYAGESAGACVAGNSLRGIEKADNSEFAEEEIWSGLNLIPNFVLPHADNPAFSEDIAYNLELHKDDPTMVVLKDSEALVVEDSQQKIVSREDS